MNGYAMYVCPPEYIEELSANVIKNKGGRGLIDKEHKLSPQETRVARLASEGLSNKQIANLMGIKTYTVIYYLQRVFAKKNINSRVLLAGVLERENLEQC